MLGTKFTDAARTLLFSGVVVILVAFALLFAAKFNTADARNAPTNSFSSATFAANGASLGSIPDGTAVVPPACGPARNVTFTVSGTTGPVYSVKVAFSADHTWVGDLEATLIAPNGAAHLLFARTGSTDSDPGQNGTLWGYDTDLFSGNTYTFDDSANSDWWNAAQVDPVPTSESRTVVSGGPGTTDPPAVTTMNSDFASVTNANGTWTLRFRDCSEQETGTVTAATLTLSTAGTVAHNANVDMNGDGKSDFVITRQESSSFASSDIASGTSPRILNPEVRLHRSQLRRERNAANLVSSPMTWYTTLNGDNNYTTVQFGDATTDDIVSGDFDGDGKDDIAVWHYQGVAQPFFQILQSSDNTVRVDDFGLPDDDPTVVGDYDGDGRADPATFRCPVDPAPAGQCYFFFRGSLNNPAGNITYVPWGYGTDFDFFTYVGDFDGDGKNDFCIEGENPDAPGHSIFYLAKSGGGIEYIYWGLIDEDVLVPGDYDGDGRTDFCLRRPDDPTTGHRTYYLLTRTGATSSLQWGVAGDVSTPGDYDGDGKTDFAIWRGSPTPGQSVYWILNSSNGSVSVITYGQCPGGAAGCDVPVESWAVH